MAVRVVHTQSSVSHDISSLAIHKDTSLFVPPTDENWHFDRIILAAGNLGASNDEYNLLRIYSMPDDVIASTLSAVIPDDSDPNIWFKQVIYGGNPIYVSWRPKRTLRGGEILYLDTVNKAFSAVHEATYYVQALYHKL